MNRRFVALLVAACCGVGGPVTVGVAAASPAVVSATPSAHVASCTYGRINGVRKCLRSGEFCVRRYQRQYKHYGFTCSKRDRRGRWHLEDF
jgi:hypothetical protein